MAVIFDYDEKTGKITLTRVVDITPYLRANYEERKEIGKGISKSKVWRKVASIPIDVLISHGIDINDDEAIKDFIKKHPEYRTSEGGF
ncbi:asparagine synthetase B [Hydrogenobacter thermophilus TK-6]|uniref:Uncharacterized protein n=1 Tax=Hydrogenobacter thermophilus (strain DSM 6534 / IAM 12695 / TK-6) TaxID=608538 RepID=D3DGQ9_HYDTT|nr:hypothetical protein [Hydrogenobacter thermophilus]ADO44947.1 asparagine synthetase B [Hydrogenobacter thermophilus TK-6]BAI69011.1 hypothetical protein HTH_0549 [Hydrogenobacter thermophilus TK-6]